MNIDIGSVPALAKDTPILEEPGGVVASAEIQIRGGELIDPVDLILDHGPFSQEEVVPGLDDGGVAADPS